MIADFYDIESLTNAWTLCNFRPYLNRLDVYILCDEPTFYQWPGFQEAARKKILEANQNFNGTIEFYDLHMRDSILKMASTFGVSTASPVNNPSAQDDYDHYFRPVCDTDPGYDDDKYPYYMGYNSQNYDTTMLAVFFMKAIRTQTVQLEPNRDPVKQITATPPTAAELREVNNIMFSDAFKNNMPDYLTKSPRLLPNGQVTYGKADFTTTGYKIRKNMLLSGRHVDVARLNDKASKTALKRLLGMLGGQILESDKLAAGQDTLYSAEELMDLLAYNASDVINLKLVLFDHALYQGQFSLKRKLLADYPELIYEKKLDAYAPDISPYRVRRDRLFIDSSSAQLATKALCPYDHLTDIPTVSFDYPSQRKADELGIQRVNVLEETRKFFYSKFPQSELREKFDRIYNFYKLIEGKNFNESKNYAVDYELPDGTAPGAHNVKNLPACDTCLCYYNSDGTPSRGFVTFSIGGIHGAEYNKDLYESDLYAYRVQQHLLEQVQTQYPNPLDLKAAKHVVVKMADEQGHIVDVQFPAGKFLKSGSTMKKAEYKVLDNPPRLFKTDTKGGTKLNPDYVFTSADPTNHEDFTSYYPNLLRMMSAFFNEGLGYDRYAEIFYQKQDLGVLMKDKNADYRKLAAKTDPETLKRYDILRKASGCQIDPDTISDEERAVYAVQREGTKLILNSASGAADASFESNIRMNNQIISMRIIGWKLPSVLGNKCGLRVKC